MSYRTNLPPRLVLCLAAVLFEVLAVVAISAGVAADKPTKDKDAEKKQAFELTKDETALLEATNKERKLADLPPLKANEKLFKAARAHAANMAKQNQLDHTLDGKGPGDRLKDIGYEHAGWGENVAAGPLTADEAVRTWMNSEGHRANILNPQFKEVGLGIAKSGDGGLYYTQVFSSPRSR